MKAREKLQGCLRKRPYTRLEAQEVIARNVADRPLYLYRCDNPDLRRHHWHITHAKQRRLLVGSRT